MSTVTLAEAQTRLAELVGRLANEPEIIITDGDKPVAKLAAPRTAHSVLDIQPRSVGQVLQPFPHPDDDLLEEMLDNKITSDG